MSKPNAFALIMSEPEEAAPVPAKPVAKAEPVAPAEPRGRDRPRTGMKETQQTPLRMHPDDHHELKQLAARDKVQMNDLIYEAVRLYCKTRGVNLKHAPGNRK